MSRKGILTMKRLLPIALFALLAAPGGLADSPPVKSTTLLDTTRTVLGQPLALPAKDPELKVTVLEIAPGAKLPRHQHPWSRYAYVLAGDLQVTFDTGLVKQYHTGDFIVEGVKAWHFGENIGSAPVRLLVIDQTESGQPATVLAP